MANARIAHHLPHHLRLHGRWRRAVLIVMTFVAVISLITAMWLFGILIDDVCRNGFRPGLENRATEVFASVGFVSIMVLAGRDILGAF